MSAGRGARRALVAIIAVAALAAAAVYFAWPERGAGQAATAAAPDAAETRAAAPGAPVTSAAATLFPVTQAALDELAASADLRPTVSSESCATASGRAVAGATLQQAEESARHVYDLIAQSVAATRSAADMATLDATARDALHEDVRNATDRTLMLAGRLRDERLRAISAARRLIAFMEDNAGAYEVQDGAVRFMNPSAQVQFSHFQVNTGRVLEQELLIRKETAGALAEQEQLLANAQAQ